MARTKLSLKPNQQRTKPVTVTNRKRAQEKLGPHKQTNERTNNHRRMGLTDAANLFAYRALSLSLFSTGKRRDKDLR